MPNGVIDLRGSPTGLEDLGEGLAQLFAALTQDPNDELRRKLLDNPALAKQLARAGRERGRGIRSGGIPVDPRVGDAGVPTGDLSLPPTVGLGIFPPEIINELMMAFPETREEAAEVRGRAVDVAVAERLTPEEEAEFIVAGKKAAGTASLLSDLQSERMIATINAGNALGMTPEALAQLEMVLFNVESTGARLDEQGIKDFAETYDVANEADRAIIEAGLAGPRAQAFAQVLIQRERVSADQAAANMRAKLASATTELEMAESVYEFKQNIRGERNDIIDRINEAAADRDRRDELPGLIADMRNLALDLMRIDSSMVVTTANEIQGLIRRHNITGVEFDITDAMESNADKIEAWSQTLAGAGISESAVAHLSEEMKDLRGVTNQSLVLAIIERATEIQAGDRSSAEMERMAAEGARELMGDPARMTENGLRIERLEEELGVLLTETDSPQNAKLIVEKTWILRLHKLMSFFAGSGRPRSESLLSIPGRENQ
ncbi:hypothetical protein LCGC14_2033010 [marine sediment metagenome]|uniref:Uncharacterized protein n=1 Tax=marine sediment metagenome TaxID=412755 RepID=A0A0F9FGN1_9ZZZZ